MIKIIISFISATETLCIKMSSENSLGSNTKVICPPPVLEHPFTIWLSLLSGATEYAIISVCVHVLSCILLFATPWIVDYQAPLSMRFSRQEYWRRLPCPPSGDLLDPGIEPTSLTSPAMAGGFFTTRTIWEAPTVIYYILNIKAINPETHLDIPSGWSPRKW